MGRPRGTREARQLSRAQVVMVGVAMGVLVVVVQSIVQLVMDEAEAVEFLAGLGVILVTLVPASLIIFIKRW